MQDHKISFFGSFSVKMIILLLILIVSVPLCALWGSADISVKEVVTFLWIRLTGGTYTGAAFMNSIVWELRIPRILLGIAVGGGLSVCGILMQALTKNMLAEPYILGVSSGASVLAVCVLTFGSKTVLKGFGVPGAAFLGSFLSLCFVYFLSMNRGKPSDSRLLLSGVAISLILNALTQFMVMISPAATAKTALYWMMGGLGAGRWGNIILPVGVSLLGLGGSIMMARVLNILSLGDENAVTMGADVGMVRKILLIMVSLVTGVLVASSGCIGFVGLMIPHIVRLLFGADHRRSLIAGYLVGAVFLIWMDVLARTILAPLEISIGILTAFCGGPFFIWILCRKKEEC